MTKEQRERLIAKYLEGTITEEESSLLETWLKDNSHNRRELKQYVWLWDRSNTFHFPKNVDTERDLATVHEKVGIRKRGKRIKMNVFQLVAALLVFGLLLSGTYYLIFSKQLGIDQDRYYQQVTAAFGTRATVDLADGTQVILNSGSTLKFPGKFTDKDSRQVSLEGEAFFNVKENKAKPFWVNVGKLDVKVLGTSFNVHEYALKQSVDITLVEGRVGIYSASHGRDERILTLLPSEIAHFDGKKNTLRKESVTNMGKYIGWIDGKLIFEDDPMDNVIRKLENWYNVDIVIKNKELLSYRYTGTFINESIDQVLSFFSQTSPLFYEIQPSSQDPDGNYHKGVVILSLTNKNELPMN